MKTDEENKIISAMSSIAFKIAYDDYEYSDWGYDGRDERIVTMFDKCKLQDAILVAMKVARNEALEEVAAMIEPANAKLARGIRSRKMTIPPST